MKEKGFVHLCVQVTCLACDHRSNTVEPFWDLSLEFPERYHSNSRESAAQASCHLTEMLAKFTETEALEGSIYACDHCNCELNTPRISDANTSRSYCCTL